MSKAEEIRGVLEECRRKGITLEELFETFLENSPKNKPKDLSQQITEIFKDLGLPANLKGYRYLRYAIDVSIKDPGMLSRVTKGLYPMVAKQFKTTPTRVERCIRHAIEVAWDRGNPDIINRYFGYSISSSRGTPTNSEFIATIADMLLLQEG